MAPLTTIESKKAAAAASVEVLMNGSIFNDASFVMIWPLPFGHGAYLHRKRIPRKWGVSVRDTLEAATRSQHDLQLGCIPKSRGGVVTDVMLWYTLLLVIWVTDVVGGAKFIPPHRRPTSHVGAFSRSWKKECTTITYSNSTFVFEAFCSLESWHQKGRQLIMIHDWKHTHTFWK